MVSVWAASEGHVTGVPVKGELGVKAGKVQKGGGGEAAFEGVEGVEVVSGSEEGVVVFGELSEGGGDVGEVLDEAPVEASKAQEGADLLNVDGGGEVEDGFLRVGRDAVGGDGEAAEIGGGEEEGALLGVAV